MIDKTVLRARTHVHPGIFLCKEKAVASIQRKMLAVRLTEDDLASARFQHSVAMEVAR